MKGKEGKEEKCVPYEQRGIKDLLLIPRLYNKRRYRERSRQVVEGKVVDQQIPSDPQCRLISATPEVFSRDTEGLVDWRGV